MCYKIDSEIIIANYFAECEGQKELSLFTLTCIKDEIERKFNEEGKFLFIDTSRRSIMNAVISNPKYFSLNDSRSKIIFNENKINDLYEDVYFIFNSKIDPNIKFAFLKKLEDSIEQFKIVPA